MKYLRKLSVLALFSLFSLSFYSCRETAGEEDHEEMEMEHQDEMEHEDEMGHDEMDH